MPDGAAAATGAIPIGEATGTTRTTATIIALATIAVDVDTTIIHWLLTACVDVPIWVPQEETTTFAIEATADVPI